jgi:pimeloyl-ACP methyl ester carboxylesterase
LNKTAPAMLLAIALAGCASAPGPDGLRHTEHRLAITSTAPSMKGQPAELYLREITPADGKPRPVVLFVHGAGTPAEVSFDSRMPDYSWMGQVAQAGFDVFAVSLTGYGRSTRPPQMADPCNLAKDRQPGYVTGACGPAGKTPLATSTSDWDEVGLVVEHLRRIRGVEKVSLVAWSQGGARVTGFALRHPEQVERIVALAPAYTRDGPLESPTALPVMNDGLMTVQSRPEFLANWDRQAGCPGQYDKTAAGRIFDEMLDSDPVGARWQSGVRRAPIVPIRGFEKTAAGRVKTPFLVITGEQDKQVAPSRVRDFYEDLGSSDKVLVDLACSSHNAMWEVHRDILFDATVQWLRSGRLNGSSQGIVRLGY